MPRIFTRSEQSRINGSRSQGPVTDAGRARSALNRTTHGMYSSRVVLENESLDIFNLLAAAYHGLFEPRDQFETDLVENMVNARWRIRRLEAVHSAELNLTTAQHRVDVKYKFGPVDPATQTALAYRAGAKNIDVLEEHLERQHRIFLRSYRALRTYRKGDLPPQDKLAAAESALPSPPPQPAPERENPGNEPSARPQPGAFRKIAILIVLLLSAIASTFHWNATKSIERTPPNSHAAL
ncbi:MAG: hypothetical protein JNK48_20500 [Bryobacterales bacterium]|nr:hypothetical protein [Bryobacterales bacterium]